ncbi:putative membrane protein [Paenibacillus phyllosphaerae]|uniref:Putative membrane protein n=1 Tax=Paenibacillus phyllosphaerae TaxID=274593 RepID=A0A7W5FP20_9BACL|nr:YhgE/Pip domain-containing protein [Paenibacillus phyllosphaerae]MBB3111895.1 putative membrane protein [Paenibacillus phyllosphaerae]
MNRSWLGTEWGTLIRTPKTLISLIGIICIPVLYSGIYLWAFWDPYGNLERLSVAVVNEDQPAVYEGETFKIGEDLVAEFQKDRSFDWQFLTREEADQGLADQKYYFSILIPSDFSKRATTLMEQQPTPLEITIKSNEGLNYIVAKIGQSGVEKIRQQLSEKLTLNYTESIFKSLEELKDGMQEASTGAGDLHTGIGTLLNGTKKLASSVTGNQSSIAQLDQGAADLKAAAAKLASGAAQLNTGFGKLATGTKQIDEGIASAVSGSKQLAAGLTPLAEGAAQVDKLVSAYAAGHPDASADATFQTLTAASKQVSAGLAQVNTSMGTFNTGLGQLTTKHAELLKGVNTFTPSLKQLASGADQLSSGAASLYTGVHKLSTAWTALVNGIDELSTGEQKLYTGSRELETALTDGAEKLANIHSSQSLFEMMANPVRVKEDKINTLPNYGTGMAPFFVSISLYVGALLLTTVFPLRETLTPAPSGFLWFLSKYAVMATVSLGQALLVAFILTGVVGLEPMDPVYFGLYAFYVSLIFMAIIQFLVTLGDNVGRFIAIILLVLQLAATSGTFPVELGPEGLQTIHRFLPITYTVDGFRSILSTGDYALLRQDVWLLLIYWAVAVALTIVLLATVVRRKKRRNQREQAPA